MKPFDPSAAKYTKASGFHGAQCWQCYVDYQREYIREWRKARPELADSPQFN